MTTSVSSALILVAILATILAVIRAIRLSIQTLTLALTGLIVGLLVGALLSIPLSNLPAPYGTSIPLALSLVLALAMMSIILAKRASILHLIPQLRVTSDSPRQATARQEILVDTSAIIDGRVADVARAGFIHGRLLIPRFVLAELQNIADSEDAMRRSRGRRGLETLNVIRELPGVESEIISDTVDEIKEVDAKLVVLAKRRSADILTTDYNLNRVAQIEGVKVLNVNELSNAIRPVVIPGEFMTVRVVQAGKERGQGVGYLADGTMIVVDQGDKLIGQDVQTEVTRVFQTVAGKMIFAAPVGQPNTPPARQQHKQAQPKVQPAAEQTPGVDHALANPQPPNNDAQPKPARPPKSRRYGNNRNRGKRPDLEQSLIDHVNNPQN